MNSTAQTSERGFSIWEAAGLSYRLIPDPTTDILEKRVAQLERGVSALAIASGQRRTRLCLSDTRRSREQYRSAASVLRQDAHSLTHTLQRHGVGVVARSPASDRAAIGL